MCLRKVFGISADDFLDGRIDFAYIAYKHSNAKFSLEKHLLKEEAAENHQLELLRAA